jgi:hypothetical protein
MLADTIWLRAEFFRVVPALTAQEVAILAGLTGEDGTRTVEQWRSEGLVFAVKRDIHLLYPAFQFDAKMRPRPVIHKILSTLRQHAARSDWDNAFWFISANGWLDGPAPKDLLETEPELLVEAAEQEVLPDIE